jgi:hypothetical protein
MLLAITGFLMLIAPAPIRLLTAVRLMNGYPVDAYLSDPAARRLWLANVGLAFLIPIGLVLLAIASGVLGIAIPVGLLALLVTWRLVWKIRLRLSGRYREFYRAAQWSGPPAKVPVRK